MANGTSPNQLSSPGQFAVSLLPPDLQQRAMDTFTYNVQILPVLASSSNTGTVTINNDADFLWVSTAGVVTETDNVTFLTDVPATVLVTDNGAGRTLSDVAVAWNNYIGTAQNPVYLDYPKYLARATSITIQYNNLAATDYNVRIALRGFKIFTYKPQ